MNFAQKAGRVVLLTSTLVVASILAAMLGALCLFLMEKGRAMGSTHELLNGLGIILVGICVNAACLLVLMQIKKADNLLVPPRSETPKPS